MGVFALRHWIGQGRKANPTEDQAQPQWRELPLHELPGVTQWAAEVVRPDGWTVRVAHNAPTRLLEELLGVRSC